jgi:hypothetical protein
LTLPKVAFDWMGAGDYPQVAAAEILAFMRAIVTAR